VAVQYTTDPAVNKMMQQMMDMHAEWEIRNGVLGYSSTRHFHAYYSLEGAYHIAQQWNDRCEDCGLPLEEIAKGLWCIDERCPLSFPKELIA